jgi:Tol biopolymer transport system component
MDTDGGGQTKLTDLAANNFEAAWSPDGRQIAFSSDRDGANFQVYKMKADGSGQTLLSNDSPNADFAPSWSPDGGRITFMTNRDGDFFFQIYVMNADGSSPTNLTNDLSRRHRFPNWGQARYKAP